MNKITAGTVPFYQFSLFSDCREIVHFVSSGLKTIGFSEDREEKTVRENRLELAESAGFDAARWVMGHQVHSSHVTIVTEAEAGSGALDKASRLANTDALVTDREGICLTVLSADCVPVLLYDPECRVVAAIHAGWRGTAAQIVVRTIECMKEEFGCQPGNLLAGIGPSIGKCCFEVGEEVAMAFRHLFPESSGVVEARGQAGKYQVDLWEANRLELLAAGVKDENIEVAGMCTVCHPDRFFSYRREGKAAGRFGAGIMLKISQDHQ